MHTSTGPTEGCSMRTDLAVSCSFTDFQFFSTDSLSGAAIRNFSRCDDLIAILGATPSPGGGLQQCISSSAQAHPTWIFMFHSKLLFWRSHSSYCPTLQKPHFARTLAVPPTEQLFEYLFTDMALLLSILYTYRNSVSIRIILVTYTSATQPRC